MSWKRNYGTIVFVLGLILLTIQIYRGVIELWRDFNYPLLAMFIIITIIGIILLILNYQPLKGLGFSIEVA